MKRVILTVERKVDNMFNLVMRTNTSAFCEPENGERDDYFEGQETVRVLQIIEQQIKSGERSGVIMDINGNNVGKWEFN